MKRAGYGLVLVLAAISGCIELPLIRDNDRKPATKSERPPSTPVTAAEVNESNALERADALQRELDDEAKNEKRAAVNDSGKKTLP